MCIRSVMFSIFFYSFPPLQKSQCLQKGLSWPRTTTVWWVRVTQTRSKLMHIIIFSNARISIMFGANLMNVEEFLNCTSLPFIELCLDVNFPSIEKYCIFKSFWPLFIQISLIEIKDLFYKIDCTLIYLIYFMLDHP